MAADLIKAQRQGGDDSLDMAKLEERYETMLDHHAPNLEQRASSSYCKTPAESNVKAEHDAAGAQTAPEPATEMSQQAQSMKR